MYRIDRLGGDGLRLDLLGPAAGLQHRRLIARDNALRQGFHPDLARQFQVFRRHFGHPLEVVTSLDGIVRPDEPVAEVDGLEVLRRFHVQRPQVGAIHTHGDDATAAVEVSQFFISLNFARNIPKSIDKKSEMSYYNGVL